MRVEAGRERAVHLQKAEDPLARLGRDLRRLRGGGQPGDHVELAPPGDLRARAPGRPSAARSAAARARARPRRRRRSRAAAAARRARRGSPRAGRTRPPPVRRWGTSRSSSATATAWPSRLTERTSTAIALRRDALAGHEALDVGGHRLGLGALVDAAPELDLAAGATGRPQAEAPGRGLDHGRRGGEHALGAAEGLGQDHLLRPGERLAEGGDVLRRRAADAVGRRVVVARGHELAVPGHEAHEPQLGVGQVGEVVDEHVVEALGDAAPHVGVVLEQPRGAQHEVAGVERARRREHRVVEGVDPGELPGQQRARAVGLVLGRQAGGPGLVLGRGDRPAP